MEHPTHSFLHLGKVSLAQADQARVHSLMVDQDKTHSEQLALEWGLWAQHLGQGLGLVPREHHCLAEHLGIQQDQVDWV